jgi:hypothetical protein
MMRRPTWIVSVPTSIYAELLRRTNGYPIVAKIGRGQLGEIRDPGRGSQRGPPRDKPVEERSETLKQPRQGLKSAKNEDPGAMREDKVQLKKLID